MYEDRPDYLMILKDISKDAYYIRITSDPKRRFQAVKKYDKWVGLEFQSHILLKILEPVKRSELKKFINSIVGPQRQELTSRSPKHQQFSMGVYQLSTKLLERLLTSIRFEYAVESVTQ